VNSIIKFDKFDNQYFYNLENISDLPKILNELAVTIENQSTIYEDTSLGYTKKFKQISMRLSEHIYIFKIFNNNAISHNGTINKLKFNDDHYLCLNIDKLHNLTKMTEIYKKILFQFQNEWIVTTHKAPTFVRKDPKIFSLYVKQTDSLMYEPQLVDCIKTLNISLFEDIQCSNLWESPEGLIKPDKTYLWIRTKKLAEIQNKLGLIFIEKFKDYPDYDLNFNFL